MKTQMILAAAAAMMTAAPALAQDAEAGERVWGQCRACHMIQDDDGGHPARRPHRPNLYNIIGSHRRHRRRVSAIPTDGRGGRGRAGLGRGDHRGLSADPTAFLREYLDDNSARGNMAFQLRREEQAHDMAAYLATVSPDAPEGEEGEEES
jgi:cytochrome c